MQPRLNIALKACRLASDLILKIYKSKDQDDLRSYSNIGALIYKHLIEIINESYPLGVDDFLGFSKDSFLKLSESKIKKLEKISKK